MHCLSASCCCMDLFKLCCQTNFVKSMLSHDPSQRPTTQDILHELKQLKTRRRSPPANNTVFANRFQHTELWRCCLIVVDSSSVPILKHKLKTFLFTIRYDTIGYINVRPKADE